MDWLNTTLLPTFILTLLLGLTVIKIVSLKKTNGRLTRELSETTSSFNRSRKQLATLQNKQATAEEFQRDLNKAELTAQLQKPRTSLQASFGTSNAPEKYSYIHSLMQKGMSAEEIGSILAISTHEAKQLVTLSTIAKAK
jgi:hypothetical protein